MKSDLMIRCISILILFFFFENACCVSQNKKEITIKKSKGQSYGVSARGNICVGDASVNTEKPDLGDFVATHAAFKTTSFPGVLINIYILHAYLLTLHNQAMAVEEGFPVVPTCLKLITVPQIKTCLQE